jgi:D-beta-D-heptose 7-phosphate kinase/D-beta-D-heptose 1-phosphate adenosyltransferase
VDTSGILLDPAFSTTVKTRVIARNQQVVRVDRERPAPLPEAAAARAAEWLDHALGDARALVVADYGKGFLSQPLADFLCSAARRRGVILTVDPHPHTSLTWKGATAVKPNRAEAFLAAGLPPSEPVTPVAADRALLAAGSRLLELWQPGCLLVTLGEHGMLLFEPSAEPWHIPTRARDVFDVSGAGDTAIAAFTLGLAAGASPREASELANRASGIAVGKLGTATVTVSELSPY